MPRKKKHVRLVAHVPESLARAIKHESVDRNLTIGELVEEAFSNRVFMIRRQEHPVGETK